MLMPPDQQRTTIVKNNLRDRNAEFTRASDQRWSAERAEQGRSLRSRLGRARYLTDMAKHHRVAVAKVVLGFQPIPDPLGRVATIVDHPYALCYAALSNPRLIGFEQGYPSIPSRVLTVRC